MLSVLSIILFDSIRQLEIRNYRLHNKQAEVLKEIKQAVVGWETFMTLANG